MGEANMLYAEGHWKQAVALLLEITKSHPKFADPYLTLGNIYKEVNKPKKVWTYSSLFILVLTPVQAIGFMKAGAAYQKQKNPDLWKKVASLCQVYSQIFLLNCLRK